MIPLRRELTLRTDARSDLIRSVNDDSSAAEKALWHAVVEMEDWVEAGLLVDTPTVQRLLDRVDVVLARFTPTATGTRE